ncbi:hypothetical protein Tco_1031791 [Tanacetum coccineum]|uniref:Uncharacterized protein n=1 Tax=Tanacetum coccineum TaxID=301880 RepID=A0ABQ5GAI6_9ASTR
MWGALRRRRGGGGRNDRRRWWWGGGRIKGEGESSDVDVTPPNPDSSDKEQGGKLGPASLQKDGSSLNSFRSSGGGKSMPDASEKKWDAS